MAVSQRGRQFLIVSASWLALDQLTKQVVVHTFGQPGARDIILVPGWLDLNYTLNPGAAFGMLRDHPASRLILVVVALGALAAMIAYRHSILTLPTIERIGLALVAAGAAGNLIDRVLRGGHVVDFIHFHISRIGFDWPVFNVSDIGVTCGMFAWIAHTIYHELRHGPPAAGDETAGGETADDHRQDASAA